MDGVSADADTVMRRHGRFVIRRFDRIGRLGLLGGFGFDMLCLCDPGGHEGEGENAGQQQGWEMAHGNPWGWAESIDEYAAPSADATVTKVLGCRG